MLLTTFLWEPETTIGRRFARFQNDWQGGRYPAIADDAADARTFAFRLLCFFAVYFSSWQNHETTHPPLPPLAPGISMGCKKLQSWLTS